MKFDMRQKTIAAALAAAFIAPATALADNGNVTVYGVFDVTFESVHNDKTTRSNYSPQVLTNSSRLGFKGREDLGGGLQAIYQLEAQVNATGADGTPGTLFNSQRNSNVGLKGDFGMLFAGYWDTPYKMSRKKVQMLENDSTFAAINIIGRESLSGASFVTRQPSLQYWSPNFNGFEVKLGYKPAGDDNTPVAPGIDVSKTVVSLATSYENERFYLTYGYEAMDDVKTTLTASTYTAVANLTNRANRVIGVYKFKDGQAGLTYERLDIAQAASSTATVARNAWSLSGKYKMGNSHVGGFYTRADDTDGTPDSGAQQFTVRYGYNFSKRTELYGAYTNLNNDTNGKYKFESKAVDSPAGSTSTGLGVGIVHIF